MMKSDLSSSKCLEQQCEVECIEQILDTSFTQVIPIICLLYNNQLAERDVFCYVANIICELTQYIVFENCGNQNGQAIHVRSQNQRALISMTSVFAQLPQGFYIKFTIRTGSSYQKQLKDVQKIQEFIKKIIRKPDTDDIYEITCEWIKENLV